MSHYTAEDIKKLSAENVKEASEEYWAMQEKVLEELNKLKKCEDKPATTHELNKIGILLYFLSEAQTKYLLFREIFGSHNESEHCENVARRILDQEWRLNAHRWKDKMIDEDGEEWVIKSTNEVKE